MADTPSSLEEGNGSIPIENSSPSDNDKIADNRTRAQIAGSDLLYSIEDNPSWDQIIFFSFQHYLALFGGLLAKTYMIAPVLCIGPGNPAKAHLVSTCGFVSGLATLLQSTIGVRLPIVQTPGVVFLLPVIAYLTSPEWKCPDTFTNSVNGVSTLTEEEEEHMWQVRMREVQGSILVASLLEVLVGLSGLTSYLMKFVTPLVIMPVLALTGLSLFEKASSMASSSWGIASLTMILLIIFSYALGKVAIPCCSYTRQDGCRTKPFYLFKFYPVLLSMIISWIISVILTSYDVYPVGSKARTDYDYEILVNSPWFRIPYPGQWGLPSISFAGGFGMVMAVITSIVDTIGDYYACTVLSGAPPLPKHALSRGVLFDGVGGVLSALWGTGNSSTSSSGNIAVIGVTKVGSRRVVQVAAVLMMLLGSFSKFGALFVTIPEPIIGGVFFVLFSVNTTVGLANLQYVDLNSSRNLLVVGFPLFCGLAIPKWLDTHQDAIKTGVSDIDNILMIILRNNVFIGGFLGLLLDHCLPGTDDERGITKWSEEYKLDDSATSEEVKTCYDIPYVTNWMKKYNCFSFIPICPTFKSRECDCCKKNKKNKKTKKDLELHTNARNSAVYENYSMTTTE